MSGARLTIPTSGAGAGSGLSKAEADATYALKGEAGSAFGTQWISVAAHGAVGDGTTDNLAAFRAALAAAKAKVTATGRPVQLFVPSGRYRVVVPAGTQNALDWGTKVSLIGEHRSTTSIAVESGAGSTASCNFIWGYASTSAPFTECHFRGFELDMDGVFAPSTGYTPVLGKGFYMSFCERSSWSDLYVHGTKATAIGVDFLVDCHVQNNVVKDVGNFAAPKAAGDSGIGIGSGMWEDEHCVVSGNIVIRARNHGIFIERQGAPGSFYARGFLVTGNTVRGCFVGIADKGGAGAVIVGNIVDGCSSVGIGVARPEVGTDVNSGRDTLITSNVVSRNLTGVDLTGVRGVGRVTVQGNRVFQNTASGVLANWATPEFPSTDPARAVSIVDNDIYLNGKYGIEAGPNTNSGYAEDLTIERNRIYNNGTAGAGTNMGIRLKLFIKRLRLVGNVLFDNQATPTQATGVHLVVTGTITDGVIEGNDARGCATPWNVTQAVLAGNVVMRDNPGYTLGGPTAVTVGASPFTYTAGRGPERVYVSGGAVTSITKGGVNLGITAGAVDLAAGESTVITYTTAPTVVADRR